jgi:predicted ribosome quality control (RQC) complex YloA/Tae2 family protein
MLLKDFCSSREALRLLLAQLKSYDGLHLSHAFANSAKEVSLILENQHNTLGIQLYVSKSLTAVYLTEYKSDRKPRGQRNIFKEVWESPITELNVAINDRLFVLELDKNYKILIKFFGPNANILLYEGDNQIDAFRKNLKSDLQSTFPEFENENVGSQLKNERYIIQNNAGISTIEKTELNGFGTYELLFYEIPKFVNRNLLDQTKKIEIDRLSRYITDAEKKCKILSKQIDGIENESKKKKADLIMAYQHLFANSNSVEVEDFFTNTKVLLTIPKQKKPMEYAEELYKQQKVDKSRKQGLQDEITDLQSTIEKTKQQWAAVENAISYKELKKIIKFDTSTAKEIKLPFRRFSINGYEVYVGKSSANNDLLTLKFAKPKDLWLHAQNLGGSHVILKNKGNTNYPMPLIEKVGAIAAYYSQGRRSSMVPVIYTLKKYVRKPKGAPVGQVVVVGEKSIFVEPSLP